MIDFSDADPERPLLPEVTVQLTGLDGNAFMIIARVKRVMGQAGFAEESKQFTKEATSGDYDHLLQTCRKWVTVQ